jgi:hypothetical protein
MKAKEKANELVYKYWDIEDIYYSNAIECALIAVDELIEATKKYIAIREKVEYSKTGYDNVVHTQYNKFWQEVKNEIQKF